MFGLSVHPSTTLTVGRRRITLTYEDVTQVLVTPIHTTNRSITKGRDLSWKKRMKHWYLYQGNLSKGNGPPCYNIRNNHLTSPTLSVTSPLVTRKNQGNMNEPSEDIERPERSRPGSSRPDGCRGSSVVEGGETTKISGHGSPMETGTCWKGSWDPLSKGRSKSLV